MQDGTSGALRVSAKQLFNFICSVLAFSLFATQAVAQSFVYGPVGPEGPRMREQLWILPSGDDARPMRATVFRPDNDVADKPDGPRPMVVINHGTDEFALSQSMPVYYWLSRWFIERGYVVVLPQRRGHGATGGELTESVGTCERPDHYASGSIAADDIQAAVGFMSRQSFVLPDDIVVVGASTGGWASLAYAARNPANVRAVVNFSGGRGGHAYGQSNQICDAAKLELAARMFAAQARVPTMWLYAENDSYFNIPLAKNLARIWNAAGGRAEAHFFPPYKTEGHRIVDDQNGWDIWGAALDAFLERTRGPDRHHVPAGEDAQSAMQLSSAGGEPVK